MVKRAGLGLGVQLLPGLPGDRPGIFAGDVQAAADMEPETADSTRVLSFGILRSPGCGSAVYTNHGPLNRRVKNWQRHSGAVGKNVRVIRLGLAPEGTLQENILAGPWHPALGQSARGLALFNMLQKQAETFGHDSIRIDVPRRYQGEFFGHGNELYKPYMAIGLDKIHVRYVDGGKFVLTAIS